MEAVLWLIGFVVLFLAIRIYSSKPTISEIVIYPIKSCGPINLRRATLDRLGILNDRRWIIINAENRMVTQRTYPRLSMIQVGSLLSHPV